MICGSTTYYLSAKEKDFLQRASLFLNSYPFYLFLLFLSCFFVSFRLEVLGAIVFAVLISFILVICDDFIPALLPFLLLSTFVTNCYDSFSTFMRYAVFFPLPVVAIFYHFIYYKKPFSSGESVKGIFSVSVAITLGGIGSFSIKNYLFGAYYFLGLGAGMLGLYFCIRSQLFPKRRYDERMRFALIMTIVGSLCSYMVIAGYSLFFAHKTVQPYLLGFSRNNLSTILMFAMPFPLYLGEKRRGVEGFTVLFYASICLTTSRGGLIFGSIEFLFCCAYWIFQGPHKKVRWARFTLCLVSITVVFALCGTVASKVFLHRIIKGAVVLKDPRWTMIKEAVSRFEKNPFVGTGILDNTTTYASFKKAGTMSWYHMMIPQIIGSMGAIGLACYFYQFWGRIKLALKNYNSWSICLGVSYLGILMMSQVNPGEFCPIPFEFLTVILFIFQEKRLEQSKILPIAK